MSSTLVLKGCGLCLFNDIFHIILVISWKLVLLVEDDHIGGVMVSMLTSCTVNCGFEHSGTKRMTIKLVYAAYLLSTWHLGERAKTGWLRIRVICLNVETCLSLVCCFSKLAQ